MFFSRKKLFASNQIGVLFICMGNICRSPAAEGIFKQYVMEQQQQGRFYIDSAGTIGSHKGSDPDPRMIKAAECRGYNLDSKARKVSRKDLQEFDLVLAMDFDNLMFLYSLLKAEKDHVRLFGSFLPGAKGPTQAKSVPDPYCGKTADFETVLDMIEQAVPAIYDYCLNQIQK